MIRLNKTLRACGSPDFEEVFKTEVEQLDAGLLPLQQGLSFTSYVTASQHEVIVLRVADDEESMQIKAGIFYSGVIAGCSCADDPTPTGEQNEYCEMQFAINKKTGEAKVVLLGN